MSDDIVGQELRPAWPGAPGVECEDVQEMQSEPTRDQAAEAADEAENFAEGVEAGVLPGDPGTARMAANALHRLARRHRSVGVTAADAPQATGKAPGSPGRAPGRPKGPETGPEPKEGPSRARGRAQVEDVDARGPMPNAQQVVLITLGGPTVKDIEHAAARIDPLARFLAKGLSLVKRCKRAKKPVAERTPTGARVGTLGALADVLLLEGGHTIKEIALDLFRKAPTALIKGRDLEANVRARMAHYRRRGDRVVRDGVTGHVKVTIRIGRGI